MRWARSRGQERRRLLLRLLPLRQVQVLVLRLERVRLELPGPRVPGVDRLELGLRVRPLLEPRLPELEEQAAEHPRRRRLRACLVPSSWWRTKRTLNGQHAILHPLDSSGERNRVPPAVIQSLNELHRQEKQIG